MGRMERPCGMEKPRRNLPRRMCTVLWQKRRTFYKSVNYWAAGMTQTIAQQLAEGRAQAARENAARPTPAKGKEARDDR